MEEPEACNFTEINTLPWVFFTFFKLYKDYQIMQRTTFIHGKWKITGNLLHIYTFLCQT